MTDPSSRLRWTLTGAIIGALITAALPSLAASVGDPMRLGDTNAIDQRTILRGNASGANLIVKNTGAAPAIFLQAAKNALRVKVEAGQSPISVNASAGTATNLSADRLDGLDSSAFAPSNHGHDPSTPMQAGDTAFGIFSMKAIPWGADGSILNSEVLTVTLPAPASEPLSPEDVNTAAYGVDADETCTGSAALPTAPAGKVCIYFSEDPGDSCQNEQGFVIQNHAYYGFSIAIAAVSGVGICVVSGVWAYTAP